MLKLASKGILLVSMCITLGSSTKATTVSDTFTGCREQVGGTQYHIYKGPDGWYYQWSLDEHGVVRRDRVGAGTSQSTSEFLAETRCNLLQELSPD